MKTAHFTVICALLAPVPAALAIAPDDAPAKSQGKGASFAEFEAKVQALIKVQKEANELAAKVRGNPNASEADVQRMRALQSRISDMVSELSTYMAQDRFSDADRAEMQKIWERAMAAQTPTKKDEKKS